MIFCENDQFKKIIQLITERKDECSLLIPKNKNQMPIFKDLHEFFFEDNSPVPLEICLVLNEFISGMFPNNRFFYAMLPSKENAPNWAIIYIKLKKILKFDGTC